MPRYARTSRQLTYSLRSRSDHARREWILIANIAVFVVDADRFRAMID